MAALWDQLPWPCGTRSRGWDTEPPARVLLRGIWAGLGRLFSIFRSLLSTALTVLLAGQRQQRFAGQSRGTKGALPERPGSLSPISRVEYLTLGGWICFPSGRVEGIISNPFSVVQPEGQTMRVSWCFLASFSRGSPGLTFPTLRTAGHQPFNIGTSSYFVFFRLNPI